MNPMWVIGALAASITAANAAFAGTAWTTASLRVAAAGVTSIVCYLVATHVLRLPRSSMIPLFLHALCGVVVVWAWGPRIAVALGLAGACALALVEFRSLLPSLAFSLAAAVAWPPLGLASLGLCLVQGLPRGRDAVVWTLLGAALVLTPMAMGQMPSMTRFWIILAVGLLSLGSHRFARSLTLPRAGRSLLVVTGAFAPVLALLPLLLGPRFGWMPTGWVLAGAILACLLLGLLAMLALVGGAILASTRHDGKRVLLAFLAGAVAITVLAGASGVAFAVFPAFAAAELGATFLLDTHHRDAPRAPQARLIYPL